MYPILTERSFDLMEKENKLIFAVDKKATKEDIKEDVSKTFNVEVEKVNITNDFARGKKAFIKLKPGFDSGAIVGDMGLM